MDNLVDIFYYDYILTKIIQMYLGSAEQENIQPYLEIGTIFYKKFQDSNFKLDTEVHLKELYIKTLQFIKNIDSPIKERVTKLVDQEKIIKTEHKIDPEGDTQLKNLLFIIHCCYAIYTKNDPLENCIHHEYIKTQLEKYQNKNFLKSETKYHSTKLIRHLESLETIAYGYIFEPDDEFSLKRVFKYLSTFKFKIPVMYTFSQKIKSQIDENSKIEIIIHRDSPGEKIKWNGL